jgi:hypothetical protein
MKKQVLTVIDNSTLRGILAPAHTFSKKLLRDVIDFIELSNPQSIDETDQRIDEADKNNSWQTLDDAKKA